MNLASYAGSIAANVAGFLLSLVGLVAVSPAASASEEPLLLAKTINLRHISGWTPAWAAPTITGVQFYLSYRELTVLVTNQQGTGTFLKTDEMALAEAIGGDLVLSNGQVGVFDFAATNSRAFAGFAARLTDSVEDTIIHGDLGYSEEFLLGGYQQPQGESDLWDSASPRGLRGFTIKFFRLIVSTLDWGIIEGEDEFRIVRSWQWQVYGYPPPVPTKLCVYRAPLEGLIVSWPTQAVGFSLQGGKGLGFPMTNVRASPVVIGSNNTVLLPASEAAGLFRLVYPPE